MAIISITEPLELTPAYNDNFVIVDSDNADKGGFRYICEVYVNEVLTFTFRIAPEFGTGYGKQNLSRLISSLLTGTFNHEDFEDLWVDDVNYLDGLNHSYVNVKLDWKEEYNDDLWSFQSYGFGGSPFWDNSNLAVNPTGDTRTMLYTTNSANVPPYSVGDVIQPIQSASPTYPEFRSELVGSFRVLDVQTLSPAVSGIHHIVVLDTPWIGSGSESAGTTKYSDGRKFVSEVLYSTDEFIFWNGSLLVILFKNYAVNPAVFLTAINIKFTSILNVRSSPWKVKKDSKCFFQLRSQGEEFDVIFKDLNDNVLTSYTVPADTELPLIDVSPRKLGTIQDYKVTTDLNSGVFEEFVFLIDNKCYGFPNIEIVFMDRLGSLIPFQFDLLRSQRVTTQRETFKKQIEYAEMYDYSLLDAGEVDITIEQDRSYTLRTRALTADEAKMLTQLISSPWTVCKFAENNEYLRVNVTTSNIEVKDEYFEQPRFYEIEIKLANRDRVNW